MLILVIVWQPLALPFASIDWGKSKLSDGDKIKQVYSMVIKECGGVIRAARNICLSVKNLNTHSIEYSELENVISRASKEMIDKLVTRINKLYEDF